MTADGFLVNVMHSSAVFSGIFEAYFESVGYEPDIEPLSFTPVENERLRQTMMEGIGAVQR